MCHPGVHDDSLKDAGTRLKQQREAELQALTDPALPRIATREKIEMISYSELD
jgi:predicted glycoside hydrolase/deacetylase ChbG (UPF0249 family)